MNREKHTLHIVQKMASTRWLAGLCITRIHDCAQNIFLNAVKNTTSGASCIHGQVANKRVTSQVPVSGESLPAWHREVSRSTFPGFGLRD